MRCATRPDMPPRLSQHAGVARNRPQIGRQLGSDGSRKVGLDRRMVGNCQSDSVHRRRSGREWSRSLEDLSLVPGVQRARGSSTLSSTV